MPSAMTPTEAREWGVKMKVEPPESRSCAYCGKVLEPRGAVIGGEIVFWIPTLPRCSCEKAQRYWRQKDAEAEARKAEEAERERQRVIQSGIERLRGQSGIKKRFKERTFANYKTETAGQKRAWKTAKEYADNFKQHSEAGEGLYIEGTNGTGKTHLAVAIALELIDRGIPVICKTANELLSDIKRAYDEDVSEWEILSTYQKVDLLIIDDLGKELCSDWSMSMLYAILNERYEEMRPTIITTNYNAEGLVKALTPKGCDETKIEAIISRLRETSTVMTMAWKDYRGG